MNSSLSEKLAELITNLPNHKQKKLIERSLAVLLRLGEADMDRLDWKILAATLEDLEQGFQVFYPYRHIRKVTIFGSARISPDASEYQLAVEFARRLAELGFLILTGAGGGIMQAGNEGATRQHSFGLNIQLPFEQEANPFIVGDEKLIDFKYFFIRKLFFLRESDAVALFPGGFGTQDEAFETLTLCSTGKYGPVPLVLIDEPAGNYWQKWHQNIKDNLLQRGLISSDHLSLYRITNDLDVACNIIRDFYRIYHSSRYVENQLVLRLNSELSDSQVEQLNELFPDILLQGKIRKSGALPPEKKDKTAHLPRLILYFNRQKYGRLYELINHINQLEIESLSDNKPEYK